MSRILKLALALAFALTLTHHSFAQIIPPQGRLTLQSGIPVMTTDVVNATTIYYTPYVGNSLVVSNGTSLSNQPFSQLSLVPGANLEAGYPADLYAYYTGSTYYLCISPDWSSSTARQTAGALTTLQGISVNAGSLPCYTASEEFLMPAKTGVYLGTIYDSPSGSGQTVSVILKPSPTSGGSANFIGLWNAYNRVPIISTSQDSNTSWTVTPYSWAAADSGISNGAGNRITWIDGLQQTQVSGYYSVFAAGGGTLPAYPQIGIDLDSTSNAPNVPSAFGQYAASWGFSLEANEAFNPQLGAHYIQAMNAEGGASSSTATFSGNAGGLQIQSLVLHSEY